MKVGEGGEAFFVVETMDDDSTHTPFYTSPMPELSKELVRSFEFV